MRLLTIVLFCVLVFGTACRQEKERRKVKAVELTRADTCAQDGMILLDYAGPKAQIVWRDGSRDYFCEAREAIGVMRSPVEQKRAVGFFVQDFGSVEWGAYPDRWIDSQDAIFVVDSKQSGAMGISYVPFSLKEDAAKFQLVHGGEIVEFAEISADIFERTMEIQKERLQGAHSGHEGH